MYHRRRASTFPAGIMATSSTRQKLHVCGGISVHGPTAFQAEFFTQKIPIYDYDLDKWVRTRTRTRNQQIFSGKSPDTRTHFTRFFRVNHPII